jgi:hypothetical protein
MRHEYIDCIFRLTTEFNGARSKHSKISSTKGRQYFDQMRDYKLPMQSVAVWRSTVVFVILSGLERRQTKWMK